ncbi:MAG: hypothetical protein KGI75_24160 [Rhizobiaceae bacterium]|nr:hypothetical protein [Rhizobiaceae bacterium]
MKFFFHVRDIGGFEPDLEGLELPCLADAIEEARKVAREMIAELVLHGHRVDGRAFLIADERGVILRAVVFKDILGLD